MKQKKEGVGMFTYEIKINGKSTGWYGQHSDCVEILKKYDNWNFYLFFKLVISVGITFKLINLFLRFNNIFNFLLVPFLLIWLVTSEAV